MGFLKCFITLATGGRMGSTDDELADTAEPAEMSESFIMDENREDYSVLRTPLRCQAHKALFGATNFSRMK